MFSFYHIPALLRKSYFRVQKSKLDGFLTQGKLKAKPEDFGFTLCKADKNFYEVLPGFGVGSQETFSLNADRIEKVTSIVKFLEQQRSLHQNEKKG